MLVGKLYNQQLRVRRGFTIVELLIVIVVIAILAAITIVSYQGVQQRANNAAVIDAASKSMRMMQAYYATYGGYPAAVGACITVDVGCATGSAYAASATFNTNIALVGAVPRSVPISGPDHYGVVYYYSTARVVDGSPRPVVILYWLQGTSQACGLSNLVVDPNAASTTTTSAAYTASNDSASGKTLCAISMPQ